MSNVLQNYFMIDGTASTTWGIWINGDGVWKGSEPDIESVSIPGRNGDLTLSNNRWHNSEVYYRCFIPALFKGRFSSFRATLLNKVGYFRLEDTYNPNKFRKARISGGLDISSIEWANDTGSFTVRFDCMPQRFLTSGETYETISSSGDTIVNQTLYDALPNIRTKGYGTITFTNGTYTCSITIGTNSFTYFLYTSCEEMDCRKSDYTNRNSYLTLNSGSFPKLPPGTTTITYDNTFTDVAIKPLWWTL